MRNTRVHRSGKLGWLPVGLATLALVLTVGCQSAAPAKPAATAAATTAPAATAAATRPATTPAATTAPAAPAAGGAGDATRGGQAYATSCKGCHPASLPNLATLSDADRTKVIKSGKGAMPAVGASFSDPQIADLLAYLKTLP